MMVAEAARNIVCSGGRPLAATNCLNFGNPEHPESDVANSVKSSMACPKPVPRLKRPSPEATSALQRNARRRHLSDASIGMVGLIENLAQCHDVVFQRRWHSIVLVKRTSSFDSDQLDDERALQLMVLTAIQDGLVKSAHDISDGGWRVAIAECCYATGERRQSERL